MFNLKKRGSVVVVFFVVVCLSFVCACFVALLLVFCANLSLTLTLQVKP